MTEGPEGHLYCQKYTKYTEYTTQIKHFFAVLERWLIFYIRLWNWAQLWLFNICSFIA